MVQDHQAANGQLMALASGKGVSIPQELDKEHRAAAEKLQKASGANFDREFVQTAVKDHEKAVKLFQQEAQSSQDAELKQFAQSTLPTLKEHLQMAQQIEQNMRAPQTSQSRSSTTGQSGSSTQGRMR
jgi:putative membrane protein